MLNLEDCTIPGNGVTIILTEDTVQRIEEDIKTKSHATQRRELQENMSKVYNIIWGQCTEYVKARIEATENYETLCE